MIRHQRTGRVKHFQLEVGSMISVLDFNQSVTSRGGKIRVGFAILQKHENVVVFVSELY